jgi:hypothetical protein
MGAPKLKDVKINITKILWRLPIVKVSNFKKNTAVKNSKPSETSKMCV